MKGIPWALGSGDDWGKSDIFNLQKPTVVADIISFMRFKFEYWISASES